MADKSTRRKLSFGVTAVIVITVVFAMFGLRVYWETPPGPVIAATVNDGSQGLNLELAGGMPSADVDAEVGVVEGRPDVEPAAQYMDRSESYDDPDILTGPDIEDVASVDGEDFDRQAEALDAEGDGNFVVQSVLSAAQSAVISGRMDGLITQMPFNSGDVFKAGDVLVKYECEYEKARVKEIQSRIRVSNRRLEALSRLRDGGTASDVEYLSAVEENKQNKALLEQAQSVEEKCTITAPFDGRVLDKQASAFEAARSGRVLMRVGSLEPLEAELLIPSLWLRWINVGTPVSVYINESNKTYEASIVRIHGEVDPVSRTAHVVAKMDEYKEELLPGMSGSARFDKLDLDVSFGFLGMNLSNNDER